MPSPKALSKLTKLPLIMSIVINTSMPWQELPSVDIRVSQYAEGTWLEPIFLLNLAHLDFGMFTMALYTIVNAIVHAHNLESLS
jgi:hypothetical protein